MSATTAQTTESMVAWTAYFGVFAVGFAAAAVTPRIRHHYHLSHLDAELARIQATKRKFADGTITPTNTSRDDLSRPFFRGFDCLGHWLRENNVLDYNQFIPDVQPAASATWYEEDGRVVEEV